MLSPKKYEWIYVPGGIATIGFLLYGLMIAKIPGAHWDWNFALLFFVVCATFAGATKFCEVYEAKGRKFLAIIPIIAWVLLVSAGLFWRIFSWRGWVPWIF